MLRAKSETLAQQRGEKYAAMFGCPAACHRMRGRHTHTLMLDVGGTIASCLVE
jgi:hypothetical protein